MPYDLQNLESFLQSIKSNAKVSMSSIGNTIMGKHIPLVKIESLDKSNPIPKKVIVILARQHPG
jgi:murein tripeptide amidase MpaA